MKINQLKTILVILLFIGVFQNCDNLESFNSSEELGSVIENPVERPSSKIIEKTKCTFYLTGSSNYEWRSERYIKPELSCEDEMSIVAANNPRASVRKGDDIYVFDNTDARDKWKCVYTLTGQRGDQWVVERYASNQSLCETSELDIVQTKNPNASIEGESIYVHDGIFSADKWKCVYSLTGQRGYEWAVERYAFNENECIEEELSIVELNNPNARITVESNYVFDPF